MSFGERPASWKLHTEKKQLTLFGRSPSTLTSAATYLPELLMDYDEESSFAKLTTKRAPSLSSETEEPSELKQLLCIILQAYRNSSEDPRN